VRRKDCVRGFEQVEFAVAIVVLYAGLHGIAVAIVVLCVGLHEPAAGSADSENQASSWEEEVGHHGKAVHQERLPVARALDR
jgi:hypothetical protein